MRTAARLSTPTKSRARPGHALVHGDQRRQIAAGQALDVAGRPSDRRDQDSGDVLGAQLVENGELALFAVVAVADDDRIVRGDGDVLDHANRRCPERVGYVADDDADQTAPAEAQAPRDRVRRIADRGGRRQDPTLRLLAHRPLVVQRGRDGGNRHAGLPGHLANIGHCLKKVRTLPETFRDSGQYKTSGANPDNCPDHMPALHEHRQRGTSRNVSSATTKRDRDQTQRGHGDRYKWEEMP